MSDKNKLLPQRSKVRVTYVFKVSIGHDQIFFNSIMKLYKMYPPINTAFSIAYISVYCVPKGGQNSLPSYHVWRPPDAIMSKQNTLPPLLANCPL